MADTNDYDLRFQCISDGQGGSIFTWIENNDIYIQRIDSDGNQLWGNNGVVLCNQTDGQTNPAICGDGNGGAIVVWQDGRNDIADIYAQRVNSSGHTQWTKNGTEISTQTSYQAAPDITSDQEGGAVIIWRDQRTGNNHVYAQKINNTGHVKWTNDGVGICTTGDYYGYHDLIHDDTGGAIIAWEDRRTATEDIYAQRINGTGEIKWTVNGIPICAATNGQYDIDMRTDGNGGAIIVWNDERTGIYGSIYTQHVNASGNIQWNVNGAEIYTVSVEGGGGPEIIDDNKGGSVIVWYNKRDSSTYDIFAQRIDSSANKLWTADGIKICDAEGNQRDQRIIEAESGKFIITFSDERVGASEDDIYGQCIDLEGKLHWGSSGKAICTVTGEQTKPKIINDPNKGGLVLWQDKREGAFNEDVYVQRIEHQPPETEDEKAEEDNDDQLAISSGFFFICFLSIGMMASIIMLKRKLKL